MVEMRYELYKQKGSQRKQAEKSQETVQRAAKALQEKFSTADGKELSGATVLKIERLNLDHSSFWSCKMNGRLQRWQSASQYAPQLVAKIVSEAAVSQTLDSLDDENSNLSWAIA